VSDARTLVFAGDGPARLESFVQAALPELSRRLVRRLIAERAVLVNDRPAVKGARLAAGDRVRVPAVPPLAPDPAMPLLIRWADDRALVVEKPGGVRGHALDPRERGTLAAALLARHPELARVGDPLAPGFVHRLDTGTSGLLVVARTAAAHAELRAAFRSHAVVKRYAAVVAGRPATGTAIAAALAHDPRERGRMVAARPGLRAWPATTRIVEVRPHGHWSLAVVEIRTGVTHQVRAHLALAGHPVVGDARYGGDPAPLAAGRHALHARRVTLAAWGLDVESPLPDDLAALAAV
jgi:23S rRNA pseudouridine1911/1915/1917 synthase